MKQILFLFCFAFALFCIPSLAEAHESQSDSTFTGELHVDPEEIPTAQENVTLQFTIIDETKKFDISRCDCEVTIAVPNKLPYTRKITTPAAATGGMYSVMVPFVFPRGGTYDLIFRGKPTTPDAFQPFNLKWNLKVKAAPNEIQTLKTPKPTVQSNPIFIALSGLLVVLISAFVFRKIMHKARK